MKPCRHLRSERVNKRKFEDKNGDKGYIADLRCKACGLIHQLNEKTITNFFRGTGLFGQ